MRSGLSTWLLVVAALPCAGAARVASAQELSVSFDSECPEVTVVDEVESALARPLSDGPTVLSARVAMRMRGRRVHVVIGLARDGARSERVLDTHDCAAAVRATALVLALALDADLGMAAAPEDAPSVPLVEAAPPSELDEVVVGAMEMSFEPRGQSTHAPAIEPHPPDVVLAMSAGGVVDAGSLPGANGGARVGAGLRLFELLCVELDATYLAAARQRSSAPGASVDVMLAYGTLRVGALFPIASLLSLGGALELVVGAAGGAGVGLRVQQSTTAWLPWVAARASAIAELVIAGPLSLRVSGSIGTPLVAPVFVVLGVESVRPSSDVLVEGAASVVLRLT